MTLTEQTQRVLCYHAPRTTTYRPGPAQPALQGVPDPLEMTHMEQTQHVLTVTPVPVKTAYAQMYIMVTSAHALPDTQAQTVKPILTNATLTPARTGPFAQTKSTATSAHALLDTRAQTVKPILTTATPTPARTVFAQTK